MRFSVWFRQWINSFFKLLTIGSKKRKSDAQRKRERERRLKARRSGSNLFRTKKKYRRRRSSFHVQNERVIGALFKFMATSLGILLIPLGLFDWGRKSAKARKKSRATTAKKSSPYSSSKKTATGSSKVITETKKKETQTRHTTTIKPAVPSAVKNKPATTSTYSYSQDTVLEEKKTEPLVVVPETPVDQDENVPKSTPKNAKDQYIRKRMIIAGSYYCDQVVLDSLEVGTRFDLEAELDNPYDKDAVKLLYNGQKIGYIAKQDGLPFVTCLKLRRKIYGVITAIIEEEGRTKYEFETWFDSNRE